MPSVQKALLLKIQISMLLIKRTAIKTKLDIQTTAGAYYLAGNIRAHI
jgi:hypothetical protein